MKRETPSPVPPLGQLFSDAAWAARLGGAPLASVPWGPEGQVPVRSLRGVNALSRWAKEAIYRRTIPSQILSDHRIDPLLLVNERDNQVVHFTCQAGTGSAIVEVRLQPTDRDRVFYLEMADSAMGQQVEVLLLVVNDLKAPRFDTDMLDELPTKFGQLRRNVAEEQRALAAGLAPGQVRRGLRIARMLLPLMEDFAASLGQREWLLQPLAYHNAILFEQHGFGYVQGRELMKWIHQEFQPGGELHAQLDGSTPFRMPEHAFTIRGRSWAIQDGILGRPWGRVTMFKRVGHDAGENTFPGAVY